MTDAAPSFVLTGVGFDYGTTRVLDGLALEVAQRELVVFVGPSGCGKSTLLGLLAGHLAPTRGTLVRHGTTRTIYQDGSLLPWLTIAENIAAGVPRESAPVIKERTASWLAIMKLEEFANHYPRQLSGGMRQRVELARALAGESHALLLDEPFSALDYQTRIRMRNELHATLRERPRTVVFVTHDIEEAVQLGDRIIVLGARPTTIRRVITLDAPRPRTPTSAGVAEAARVIMEELGLA